MTADQLNTSRTHAIDVASGDSCLVGEIRRV